MFAFASRDFVACPNEKKVEFELKIHKRNLMLSLKYGNRYE